jgi:hypothetical protein
MEIKTEKVQVRRATYEPKYTMVEETQYICPECGYKDDVYCAVQGHIVSMHTYAAYDEISFSYYYFKTFCDLELFCRYSNPRRELFGTKEAFVPGWYAVTEIDDTPIPITDFIKSITASMDESMITN